MIPIFILTCDRLESLKKSIQSYRDCIRSEYETVIIDFGSTYPPTVAFLKQIEENGTKVYWKGKISHVTQLNTANTHIQDYFKAHPKSDYVVTDSDIALDATQGDVLEVYSHFLETMSIINVAGPMLRIDDIPDCYPLKEKLLSGKMGFHKTFHSQKVHSIDYKGSKISYITAPIDTTFGMYREGSQWARLKRGVRLLAPYGARHLDWYVDPKNLTPDQAYYMKHAAQNIVNWSKI